ncbi:helix-turn-helix domain-containing protein [Streptomyces sp. M19]
MAQPRSGGRRVLTGIESSGTHPVEYRFSHARNGNRHLLVVFANFSAEGGYGWSNGVFDDLRCNILWIRDRFDGESAYYLCKGMDFSVEQSVVTLITRVLNALALTPSSARCGAAPGRQRRLYFGLRYGFRNVVSLVPQFNIGSYVRDVHPRVARHMLGDGVPEENVRVLDSVLPDVVRSVPNRKTNIYLLSSPQDEQFPVEIEPFLPLFQDYENFNFVLSDSPHISDHTTVTRRNVPSSWAWPTSSSTGSPALRHGAQRPGGDRPGHDRHRHLPQVDHPGARHLVPAADRLPALLRRATAVRRRTVHRNRPWRGTRERLGAGQVPGHPGRRPDGTWTWEPGRTWSVGEHAVRIFAVDHAGHQSRRAEVNFTVVKAPPRPSSPVPPRARNVRPTAWSSPGSPAASSRWGCGRAASCSAWPRSATTRAGRGPLGAYGKPARTPSRCSGSTPLARRPRPTRCASRSPRQRGPRRRTPTEAPVPTGPPPGPPPGPGPTRSAPPVRTTGPHHRSAPADVPSVSCRPMPKSRQPASGPAKPHGMPSGAGWLPHGYRLMPHTHDHGQLVYAAAGTLATTTERGTWVAPANRATWTPPGFAHSHRFYGRTDVRLLTIPIDLCGELVDRPSVFAVSPLLREAVLALTAERRGPRPAPTRDCSRSSSTNSATPRAVAAPARTRRRPPARRHRPAARRPARPATLAELGRAAGASERTLSRLFHTELGMSFHRWRTTLRIHHALAHLTNGMSVTDTAMACGWSNPPASSTPSTPWSARPRQLPGGPARQPAAVAVSLP